MNAPNTFTKLLVLLAAIASLAGCVVVPPHAYYVGPRVEVVGGPVYHREYRYHDNDDDRGYRAPYGRGWNHY